MSVDQSVSVAAKAVEMSVRVRGGALLDALAAVRPLVTRRATASTGERGVRVSFGPDGGSLGVEAGGVSLRLRVPEMTAEAEGEVWVAHADLNSAAGALAARRGPRSRVELVLEVGPEQVSLVGETSTSVLRPLSDVHVNPTLKVVPGTLVVDRAVFAERAAAVAIAAESGDTLPILAATRLDAYEMVATDRYRMASMPVTGSGDLDEVLPPAGAFAKVLAAAVGDTVSIGGDEKVVSVHADNLTASLLAQFGDYPKLRAIVKGFGDGPAVRVSVAAVREVLAPYVRGHGHSNVALSLTAQGFEVEVVDGKGHKVAQARIPVLEERGQVPPVFLNVGYFVDGLKIAGSEHVWLEIRESLKPIKITSNVDPDRYCVLQPVRRGSEG